MDGFGGRMASMAYKFMAAVLFGGLGSIDLNGNPKVLPRDYLDRMHLQSGDWFLDAEILIKAKRLGLPVYEFNVLGQLREGGRSNVRLGTCWEFIVNLLSYRFGRASGLKTTGGAVALAKRPAVMAGLRGRPGDDGNG